MVEQSSKRRTAEANWGEDGCDSAILASCRFLWHANCVLHPAKVRERPIMKMIALELQLLEESHHAL
jgi:hypothetical protein